MRRQRGARWWAPYERKGMQPSTGYRDRVWGGWIERASGPDRCGRTPTPQLTFLSSDDTHSEHPCCLSLRTAPGMFRQSPRSSDSTSDERGDCLNMIPTTLTPQPAPPLSSRGASSEAPTRDTHIRLAPAVRRSGSTASPARVERATSRSRQHLGERERDGSRRMHGLAHDRGDFVVQSDVT